MLLRHTASALALATALAFNGTASPLSSGFGTARSSTAPQTETGSGPGAGIVCAGCVAAAVVTVASGGWIGIWTTFMVGGSAAVGAGGAVVTCTAACIKYLGED